MNEPRNEPRTEAAESNPQSAAETKWEGILPRFSLGRPVTVLVLLATILVVGVVATVGIPLELFPRGFTPSHLVVFVPWQDAPPQEVLDKITLPLEEELGTVRGLERIVSVSYTGFSRTFMVFKQGTDMDVAYRETRDRVQRVRPTLPEDADRVFIRKEDLSGIPVYILGIALEEGLTDPYNLIQNEIVLPIERVDGVATVEVNGLEEKEILIELDRERTEASGLNIYELAGVLAQDNFTMASGNVQSGGSELLLRSVARYRTLEDLENRLLAPSVRLKDVATVRYEEAEKDYRVRVNSKPAYALIVTKEGEANTRAVCERITAVVEGMEENPRLGRIEMVPILNQGDVILDSLGTLLDSGRIGAIFAIIVLFFFLRRFRMTLIITLSIPLSVLIALTVMYFAGESLNLLTLLGLMVSIGLLVDNSVVVAENIHRLHRKGLSRREACIRGAGEIALAVIMATLTTVAVFLPVSLIPGQGQFFLLRLSVPISVSLLGSLVVALVFVPLAAYLTLPRAGTTQKQTAFRRWHERANRVLKGAYDRSLEPINHGYNRLLAVCLRHRLALCFALMVAMGITFGVAFKDVEFVFAQEDEQAGFDLDVNLPRNSTLTEAVEYFDAVERVLEEHQEEWDLAGYFFYHEETFGEVQGWFNSPRETDLSPREITEKIIETLPEKPGMKVFTGNQNQVSECTEEGVHCLTLYGDDARQLADVAEDLENILRQVDGVLGLKKSQDQTPDELALVLDRERAQRQGINPQAVAGVVGYALRGQSLPKYYQDGKEIPVRVRFQESNRESLTELQDFAVPTNAGGTVALASVTDVQMLPTARAIVRRDKRVSSTITLELEEGQEKEARQNIRELIRGMDLPEGMSFGAARTVSGTEDAQGLLMALLLSIIFIYLLMAFLFESLILPLSILGTIPLASMGVGWIHLAFGKDLDFLGIIAAILLVGVVVNNGIVLVDYANRLRLEGMARTPALLAAADRRFRPILMTAMTTICATVPLTLGGNSSLGLSYTSFGLTLIGGMTTATLLTLLVVPVLYSIFDDIREGTRHAVRSGFAYGRSDSKIEADPTVAGG